MLINEVFSIVVKKTAKKMSYVLLEHEGTGKKMMVYVEDGMGDLLDLYMTTKLGKSLKKSCGLMCILTRRILWKYHTNCKIVLEVSGMKKRRLYVLV